MDPGTPTASFVGVKSNNMPGVGPQFPAVPPGPVGSQARVSFLKEVQSMLFAFGDCRAPKLETATVVEEICQHQMAEILTRCSEVAETRGATAIGIEDVLFLMRHSPVKIQRLVQYMSVMEVVSSVKNSSGANGEPTDGVSPFETGKRVRRCREFLNRIDTDDFGVLTQAANEQLHDECRLERLRRLDRFSRDMEIKSYAEFTRARQVSFLGHQMKLSQKFQEWMTQDSSFDSSEILPLDRTALEALSYLAYETIGQIVDMSLQIRHDETTSDPILRPMAPLVFNTLYKPQVADHCPLSEEKKSRSEPISLRPLEPRHIGEAMRRLGQRPPAMGWISKSARSKLVPLIAI